MAEWRAGTREGVLNGAVGLPQGWHPMTMHCHVVVLDWHLQRNIDDESLSIHVWRQQELIVAFDWAIDGLQVLATLHRE